MKTFSRIAPTVVLLAILSVGGYIYRSQVKAAVQKLEIAVGIVAPCSQPITYSLGSFDARFGLSQEEFLNDVGKATKVWEGALGKDLFQYQDFGGDLKINLIYDYRQKATSEMAQVSTSIKGDQSTYNSLKAQYATLSASYTTEKASIQSALQTFAADKAQYEQQVSYWNARGGAPKDQYQTLQSQKDALNARAAIINQQTDKLNSDASQINSLAAGENR